MTDATKPDHPGDPPGPTCTEAERSRHANAMAKWSAWIADHPEDDHPVAPKEPQGQAANVDLGGESHGGTSGTASTSEGHPAT